VDALSQVDRKVLEKLAGMEERFCELEASLSDPDVVADRQRYTAVLREHGGMSKRVELYRNIRRLMDERDEAQAMTGDADAELAELAREDVERIAAEIEARLGELRDLFASADEHSNRNVIMEIRAGTGGDEACLFAADLFRMYSHYADKKGWKIDIIDSQPTELGGFREITFEVNGAGAYHHLRFESGAHRVQRVPKTETQGRLHTSACTVAVLPEAQEVDVQIDPADLQIDTFRASGPGGQKVNKTSSAVRMTHVPTGVVVSIQDEKSQHKNRAKALKVLRSRLYEMKLREQRDTRSAQRKNQIGTGDRSEKIRTYNFPQNRVTDHRITFTTHNLDRLMMGEMDDHIAALLEHAREAQLQELLET